MRRAGALADAHPRDEVGLSHGDSFMITRRNLWNSLGFFIGFVNISATLSAVRT